MAVATNSGLRLIGTYRGDHEHRSQKSGFPTEKA
jgi:hypothetical protein